MLSLKACSRKALHLYEIQNSMQQVNTALTEINISYSNLDHYGLKDFVGLNNLRVVRIFQKEYDPHFAQKISYVEDIVH